MRDDYCMFNKLRGVDDWPSTEATVTSTEVVSTGGRSGRTMNIYFDYKARSSSEKGKFFVDDNSSLYGLAQGEQFLIPVQSEKAIELLLFGSQIAFTNDSTRNCDCRGSICPLCSCSQVLATLGSATTRRCNIHYTHRSSSVKTGL